MRTRRAPSADASAIVGYVWVAHHQRARLLESHPRLGGRRCRRPPSGIAATFHAGGNALRIT
ncbi:MAG TPA: hypothetical protein VK116_08515 [Planctomycetota bacterium]|nr:hypothetical protein [Planctomycetota bacterium]